MKADEAGRSGAPTTAPVPGVREYLAEKVAGLRGGDVGALPALLGLLVLGTVFSQASDRFLSVYNLANLVTQSGITVLIAMGLVFVLLLGEIDLAAGTASGVCAGLMGLALTSGGDVHTALGTPVYLVVVLLTVAAAAVAAHSRLWIAFGVVLVGLLMLLTGIGTASAVGAILLAVTTGCAVGLLTGFLVARVGIPSFVVTLALFLAWQGVLLQFIGNGSAIAVRSYGIVNAIANKNLPPALGWAFYAVMVGGYAVTTVLRTRGRLRSGLSADPMPVVLVRVGALVVLGAVAVFLLNQERSPNPTTSSIKGAPYVLPLALLLMVFWTFVLNRTRFGRYVYAVGGNAEGARRAGIDVARIRVAAFAIGSSMAALGGVVQASRLGSIPSDAGGSNTLLYAVAAAVIGGTSLFGGTGRARDAVVGGLVIAIIPNGLGLLANLPASANFVITGIVLLLAAGVDALSRRRAAAG